MTKRNWIIAGIAAAMATASALFFLRRTKDKDSRPPRKAPQLKVQNPGEQSEFPTSPEDSKMER